MKIVELLESDQSNVYSTRLAAILSQISSRIKDTGSNMPMSLEALINVLSNSGIQLSKKQLIDMTSRPPVSNIIANIADDQVTFIDQEMEDTGATDPNSTTDTMKKMASRAQKKRQ